MKDLVPFDLAKKLNDKGFREECLLHYTNIGGLYSNSIDTYDRPNQELDYTDFRVCFNLGNYIGLIDAPTISQVLKWLREEKNIVFGISPMQEMDCDYLGWCATIYKVDDNGYGLSWQEELYYDTYEEATIAGIEYVLDNII